MKKIFTAILTLCMCLAMVTALVACGETSTPEHTHTFAGEWSHDATHHWHAATCEHSSEVNDKASHSWSYQATDEKHYQACACGFKATEVTHSYDDNGVCVCGRTENHATEEEFNGALLLDGVTSFTYKAETNLNHTVKLVDNSTRTFGDEQVNYLYATENTGKEVINITYDKNVTSIRTNDTPSTSINTSMYDINHSSTHYYIVEGISEYILSYQAEMGIWMQSVYSNMTFDAQKTAGLSVFQNAAGKYSQFSFDANSGTYKNAQPMEIEYQEVSDEGDNETNRLTNMYFEFKITNGRVEWMKLSADMTHETEYNDTYPTYFYLNGQLQGKKDTQSATGHIEVKYYDINSTTVTLPDNIVLDDNVTNYRCAHANLGAMERQEYFHMQKCNDCGLRVNLEMHDFEGGECVDCHYVCDHEEQIHNYGYLNDAQHSGSCDNCQAEVREAHNFDDNNYCEKCQYTLCLHANRGPTNRMDNEQHGFWCNDCNNQINSAHDYQSGVCDECGATYCEHVNLASVNYQYDNSEGHYKTCPDCYDTCLRAEHVLEGENCTVCSYVVCHHSAITSWNIYERDHSAMCPSCMEYVYGEHTLVSGVCSVCGYNEGCTHANTKLASMNEYMHATVCADCGYLISDMPQDQHNMIGGECTECDYKCAHRSTNVAYDQSTGLPIRDVDGHQIECMDCHNLTSVAHDTEVNYDNNRHTVGCRVCFYIVSEDEHTFVNGECTGCDYACEHLGVFNEGACELCGWNCPHTVWTDYVYRDDGTHDTYCMRCGIGETSNCTTNNGYDYIQPTWCSKTCEVCNGKFGTMQHVDEDDNGNCDYCDNNISALWTCEHDWEYIAGTKKGDNYHFVKCTECGVYKDTSGGIEIHSYVDGVCYKCDFVCMHEDEAFEYERSDSEGKHIEICLRCEKHVEANCVGSEMTPYTLADGSGHADVCAKCRKLMPAEAHDIENGQCTVCYAVENDGCAHDDGYRYESNCCIDGQYYHFKKCNLCGAVFGEEICSFALNTDGSSYCEHCSQQCWHSYVTYKNDSEDDGKHIGTCDDCHMVVVHENHADTPFLDAGEVHNKECYICGNKHSVGEHVDAGEGYCICGHNMLDE